MLWGFANATVEESPIVLEKTISISLDEAWLLWAEADKLTTWLTVKANIKPEVGGSYELFWDPEHPEQNSTIGCKILELNPKQSLVFQWKGPVPFADVMNVDPLPTWVRVTLISKSHTQTTIRLEHFGWKSGIKWSEAKKWQESAWLQAFSQL